MSDYSIQRYLNPILITMVGVLGTAVGWLVWSQLQDIKTNQVSEGKNQWEAIQKVADAQSTLNIAVTRLTQIVQDHIDSDEGRFKRLETPAH